ncbi:hypothetical protein, partial [Cognatishimia sp. F0-27]|uniref:hypothetical protein n=1 Tax=Cognatishimia sp. F0-27 TaxID=2816855 RepID=UPI001D0C7A6E
MALWRLHEALDLVERARARFPDHLDLALRHARVLKRLFQHEKALAVLDQFDISELPDFLTLKALLLGDCKRFDEAQATLDDVLALGAGAART